MNWNLVFLRLILVATILETIADVCFRRWGLSNKAYFLIVGAVLYFSGSMFWAFSLRHETLSKGITIFVIANMLLDVIIGLAFLQEQINWLNFVGIILGVASLILIQM